LIINAKEGIPIDQQSLVYQNRQLEHNRILAEYNIQKEYILVLIFRLRGGKYY